MIDILRDFSPEERITREGGEKLRKMILETWSTDRKIVEIDFSSKPIASVSFWDESIAKLLWEKWTEAEIWARIKLLQLHPRDREVIQRVIEARK